MSALRRGTAPDGAQHWAVRGHQTEEERCGHLSMRGRDVQVTELKTMSLRTVQSGP